MSDVRDLVFGPCQTCLRPICQCPAKHTPTSDAQAMMRERDELNKLCTAHERIEADLMEQVAQLQSRLTVSEAEHKDELRHYQASLEKQLAEAQGTIAELRGKAVKDVSECVSLTNRLTQAEQQVARMREALQVLYDEQNDAPLENRRQQWQAAMTLASGALRETGA